MRIEWDRDKECRNRRKHRLAFAVAREVFDDPLHLSILDERLEYPEERWVTVGQTRRGLCVVVVHTSMNAAGEETVRIISARRATGRERSDYEEIGH